MENKKTFTKLYDMLNKLQNLSGTNAKIDYVRMNNDVSFRNLLKWLLDTSIVSGIAEKKWDKITLDPIFDDVDDFCRNNNVSCIGDICNYLEKHNTGTDNDVKWVKMVTDIICYNDEEKEMVKKIVCKNFPLGIDVKGVNKAVPNLVPTFDVILADRFLDLDEKALNKISKNGTRKFVLQEKLDGFRCVAIKENGNVKFVSRQGKLYERLVDLENALKNCKEDNFVLDGELILTDRHSIPSGEQYKATSKIVTVKDMDIHGVTLNVFDMISLKEWNNKNSTMPYSARRDDLNELFRCNSLEPYFNLVPNIYEGNNLDIVMKELTKAKEKNWEGLMLRWSDSVYEFKRSKELLKVKPFKEMDVVIVGYEEGENKNKEKLGAFLCEIEHPEFGHLEMKVGSGYSDEERNEYWKNRDNLIGRTLEMQYFEVTENTTTHVKSVRFPVHKCIKEQGVLPNN